MQQTTGRDRVKPDGKRPVLRTTTLGGSVLIYRDSVLEAVGIDPTTQPSDRPITVTIKQAIELMGLSRRTITRMIADGRVEAARASGPEQHGISANNKTAAPPGATA